MDEKEKFMIDNDQKANWAFIKLSEDDKQLKTLDEKRKSFIKQANDWYERESNKIVENQDYLKSLLDEYRMTLPDKKVNVPAGQTIVRHSYKPVYDDDKLVKYVQTNRPDLLKYSYSKADLKRAVKNVDGKAIDENGQIVDGLNFEKQESITYKLSD